MDSVQQVGNHASNQLENRGYTLDGKDVRNIVSYLVMAIGRSLYEIRLTKDASFPHQEQRLLQ